MRRGAYNGRPHFPPVRGADPMRARLIPLAAALAAAALPAFAQPETKPADLPVSQIVLFNSGVAYYQRAGNVSGDARLDLQFPAATVNDLLKSLVLEDKGGGRIGAVSYDNRNPVEMTLKSFAIDLTRNPTVGQLLEQVRGERVEVTGTTTGALSGLIVGVEKTKVPTDKGAVIDTEQLNLLTSGGLESISLREVKRIRFVKPELEQEFRKALEVLAQSRDKQKKTVSLTFSGRGERRVRVGYVMESPMWKTSYRLALDEKEGKEKGEKLFLQGWAIVENTTDEDWNKV